MTRSIKIPSDLLDQIFAHALKDYPAECCGLILGPESNPELFSRCIPCANLQDEYHRLDPEQFPRTSANAYFLDPRQLLKIQKESRLYSEKLRIIYHSHPNSDAVFSAEDQKMAAPEGDPVYPDVAYLVVSIKNGKISEHRFFSWNSSQRKFV